MCRVDYVQQSLVSINRRVCVSFGSRRCQTASLMLHRRVCVNNRRRNENNGQIVITASCHRTLSANVGFRRLEERLRAFLVTGCSSEILGKVAKDEASELSKEDTPSAGCFHCTCYNFSSSLNDRRLSLVTPGRKVLVLLDSLGERFCSSNSQLVITFHNLVQKNVRLRNQGPSD